MENLSITTSLGMAPELVEEAQKIAQELGIPYLGRKKQSLKKLLQTREAILVVYKDRLVLEQAGGHSLYFHPDTAMLRLKSARDPLLEMIGTTPQTILDCTMGLASDSLVMASAGHQVTALESQFLIYFIVSRGLARLDSGNSRLNQAVRRIETIHTDSLNFLKSLENNSYDVLYFDPMFSEKITESDNLNGLDQLANSQRLTQEIMAEAKRVAKEKIILKAHFRDQLFEEFGFERLIRPNQKFHYGFINVK